MGVNSGHKRSRSALDSYKGYRIIKVTDIEYLRSIFDSSKFSKYPSKKEVHYTFCKDGNEKRPTQDYNAWAKTIADCKVCIDKFLEDDSLYFTEEEREKYVYKPNSKCGWAYGYDSLMKILKEHKSADKRMKILLEDRLEDANFKQECALLAQEEYEEFEQYVGDKYKFNEKFEVYTHTKHSRIKNPKELVDGLKMAIDAYFASKGIKDTSVEVKFCEEW